MAPPAELLDALAWSLIAMVIVCIGLRVYFKYTKLLWRALAVFAVFVFGALFVVSCNQVITNVMLLNGVRP